MAFLAMVFLHVTAVFMAVAVSYGGVIFFIIALRMRRTDSIRTMVATAGSVNRLIPLFFVVGGVFGLAAAIVNNMDLLAPWLVIAYLLFIVLSFYGGGLTAPTIQRIGVAVGDAPVGTLPPEAASLARRFYWIEVVDFGLLFFFIFDMVVKPFS